MKRVLLCTIIILLSGATGVVGVRAETEAVPPPPVPPGAEVLFDLLTNATVEQRLRVSRFLTNKYPTLSAELFAVINEHQPGLFGEIVPQLERLVAGKYQHLPDLIYSRLNQAPQVQTAVIEVIQAKHPEFIAELGDVEAGEDLRRRAAQLIQQKYPGLLSDVMATITQRFPTFLQELQHQVIAAFPGLLADVAGIIAKKYPDLTTKISGLIITKYPELLPGVLAILTEPLPPPEPPEAEEEAEPTGP